MFKNHNTKAIYEKKVENRGERSKMRERERGSGRERQREREKRETERERKTERDREREMKGLERKISQCILPFTSFAKITRKHLCQRLFFNKKECLA